MDPQSIITGKSIDHRYPMSQLDYMFNFLSDRDI